MSGIYVERRVTGAKDIWVVRDTKTNQIVSFGDSIVNAVQNYEVIQENEIMAKELGVNLDELTF